MRASPLMIKNLNHQKFHCLLTALSKTGKTFTLPAAEWLKRMTL